MISIVVVDDHPLFREGVVTTLMDSGEFNVLGQAGSKDGALKLIANENPDVALLDVSMPGGGLQTAKEVNELYPDVTIIMLTVSEHEDDVRTALEAGAKGYVLKGVDSARLVRIIVETYEGKQYISPNLAVKIISNKPQSNSMEDQVGELSKREKQILSKLAIGMSNREIAEAVHLSEKTIKHYMTAIMHKLKVTNRVQAALKAYEMTKKGL
jgi:DNA-binding NarL/FixJ family response regulator